MRPLFARPGTILLLAFLFLFSNLATTVLIADPTFSNVAFAQKKRKKEEERRQENKSQWRRKDMKGKNK